MNFWIFGLVLLSWVVIHLRKAHPLLGLFSVGAGCLLILNLGIQPPLPSSLLGMFMVIILASLFLYASSDSNRLNQIDDLLSQCFAPRFIPFVLFASLLLPGYSGYRAYRNSTLDLEPPPSGRTIHPAPPGEITFRGKQMDLIQADNPFRELEKKDPPTFRTHVSKGRELYYQNCVFCHGDNMEGDGLYAHGLDPIPANFQDPTTIAMLQESYLFWRIAKGGPGLPDESTPWLSAMPAWESRLSEDDIWDVILFLYDFTGRKPRTRQQQE